MSNRDGTNISNIINKNKSAVALKYDDGHKAPKIIAKGKGYVAEKILEVAEKNDIFIHTDANLAENLNRLELGGDIPPELFEIVAQIYMFADKIDSVVGDYKAGIKNKKNKKIKNVQKH